MPAIAYGAVPLSFQAYEDALTKMMPQTRLEGLCLTCRGKMIEAVAEFPSGRALIGMLPMVVSTPDRMAAAIYSLWIKTIDPDIALYATGEKPTAEAIEAFGSLPRLHA